MQLGERAEHWPVKMTTSMPVHNFDKQHSTNRDGVVTRLVHLGIGWHRLSSTHPTCAAARCSRHASHPVHSDSRHLTLQPRSSLLSPCCQANRRNSLVMQALWKRTFAFAACCGTLCQQHFQVFFSSLRSQSVCRCTGVHGPWLQRCGPQRPLSIANRPSRESPSFDCLSHVSVTEVKGLTMGELSVKVRTGQHNGTDCVNLGGAKNVIEEATCASLFGSPPLGNDTHVVQRQKQCVVEEAGKGYDKTSFLPVLRGMPKIMSQDSYSKQAKQMDAVPTSSSERPNTCSVTLLIELLLGMSLCCDLCLRTELLFVFQHVRPSTSHGRVRTPRMFGSKKNSVIRSVILHGSGTIFRLSRCSLLVKVRERRNCEDGRVTITSVASTTGAVLPANL